MTTAISADNFKTALGSCYDAIAAGTWSTAKSWYARAKAQHAGLMVTITDQSQTQTRATVLKELLEAIEAAEEAAGAGTDTERRLIRTKTSHGT